MEMATSTAKMKSPASSLALKRSPATSCKKYDILKWYSSNKKVSFHVEERFTFLVEERFTFLVLQRGNSPFYSQFEHSENCRWGVNRDFCLSSVNLRLTSPFKEPSLHTRL
jgi:hypothetical protein